MDNPANSDDPFDLARFVSAQETIYADALAELQAGHKHNHWMWYVFPQLAGLGVSPTALFYGIRSAEEARAYLAHPVLGPRLLETTRAVRAHPTKTLRAIFGTPDDMKFRSSMTLFAQIADDPAPFRDALSVFCGGQPDFRTLELLANTEQTR